MIPYVRVPDIRIGACATIEPTMACARQSSFTRSGCSLLPQFG